MTRTDVTDVTSHDVLNAPLDVVDPAIAAVLRSELTRPTIAALRAGTPRSPGRFQWIPEPHAGVG